MFSLVPLCLFIGGPHVTITHDESDLTTQAPKPCPLTPTPCTSDVGPLLYPSHPSPPP